MYSNGDWWHTGGGNDQLAPLRTSLLKFIQESKLSNRCSKAMTKAQKGDIPEPRFQESEVSALRQMFSEFLQERNCNYDMSVMHGQPFALGLVEGMLQAVTLIRVSLPI